VEQGHPDLPAIPTANCNRGGFSGCSDPGTSHGTNAVGVAVAVDNTIGTVGVAPGVEAVQVFMYKVCNLGTPPSPCPSGNCQGNAVPSINLTCFPTQLINALNHALGTISGRVIVSLSIGWKWSEVGQTSLGTTVASAWNAGYLLVAAAGNVPQVPAATAIYPAAYSQVLGVSGVKPDGSFAAAGSCPDDATASSNYGAHVSLAAPFYTNTTSGGGSYGLIWCGTSASTPFVAGAAALLWSKFPTWTNQRLKEHLLASALDQAPTGRDDYTGHGVVQTNLSDIFAPPGITASVVASRPRLTWNAVPAAGSYRIYRRLTPDAPTWTLLATTTSTSYTDASFWAQSFYGYNSIPSGSSGSYYVVAVSQTGYESQLYSSYATFLGSLLQ
jgi:serine protease